MRTPTEIRLYAKECARQMQLNSSPLEEKMMDFLDKYNVYYVFQKIFYINDSKFFIADFYFPDSKIILETDGKFHSKRVKQDTKRTELITEHYPEVKIIRWTWEDFNDDKERQLLEVLQNKKGGLESPCNPKLTINLSLT